MQIVVINGVNLNMLGQREEKEYGTFSYEQLKKELFEYAKKKNGKNEIEFFQSNIEGEIVEYIHGLADNTKVIINAGAYSHYSIAIRDAIALKKNVEFVEVHISNIYAREEFRHKSVLSAVCKGVICGFKMDGYKMAINYFSEA